MRSKILNFDSIIGNDDVKHLLNSTIKSNNLVHSYMFVVLDGIGKFLFAQEFAKMILCEDSNPACNVCSSCIKFGSNNHPDFMIIDSEDGKSIKIGQIRSMQEQISEKPIVSEKKVYIINNADLMTVEAQNCLLKTLEEPPEYAIIILVLSNENRLLNTIKSRCTKINFRKLSNEELLQYAKAHQINIDSSLLDSCNGSILKLINIKDKAVYYETIDNIIHDFSTKDIIDIWQEADILDKLNLK